MDILIQKAVNASMQPQATIPNKVQGNGNGEEKPYVPAAVTKERMEEISERVQEHLENRNISIAFSTYGDNGEKISITVKEKDTGKVIREIPAEECQRLYSRMNELMGMIFDDEF